ncbi:MAG: fumarylacetoacetate hydrolase family protein [Chloroflexi bacterium]|nr:fumarylacetoacetate hydrolase family protein [Chloroflexota bacterium]
MKLAFFNDFVLGVVRGDRIFDVTRAVQEVPHVGPHDLISRLIEQFPQHQSLLEQAAGSGQGTPLQQVRLRAPLPKPGKILCMAGNYRETGTVKEPRPFNAFLKSPNGVVGDGDTVALPKAQAPVFHHEAELGLVVGKRASQIKPEEAREHIFGWVNFIDVSARGLGPPNSDTYFWTKSWHTFAPMGPYLVTTDEVQDPQNLPVKLWVSGELRQDFSTSDMAHSIAETLAWASMITTLNPGDVLALGTNHQGLGALQDGDQVEMETTGLGRLRVTVADPLKRQWPRGVDRSAANPAFRRVSA